MPDILEGIKVLDWSTYYAGPGATALLGDMGAEVFFIETPGTGETLRGMKRQDGASSELPDGRNALFEAAARNKKSVTLNLKTKEGKEIAYRLAEKCDVFLTNYRPQLVAAHGMDSASLRKVNPRLIYAKVSGYGAEGPYSQRGAFDLMIQGHSSLTTAMREPGEAPTFLLRGVLDQTCATLAAYSIVTALYARDRLGIVQEVHTSLLGTATWILYCNVLNTLLTGEDVPRHIRKKAANPMRNLYQCGDGNWVSGSNMPPAKFWHRFCQALGIEELENDPRFEDEAVREENAEELVSILDRAFQSKTREEWLTIFDQHDLIMGPVYTTSDMVNDPQVLANQYVTEFSHQALGPVRYPGFCTHFSETPVKTKRGAPELGEHTEEVLARVAGYNPEEIGRFQREGII